MRKLVLVTLAALAVTLITGAGIGAKAEGCNDEAVINEAIASTTVDGATVSIRLWEDLTCLPAGDGVGGPTDQGHLTITVDGVEVCAVDGVDMGNDPFGFGSSIKMDAATTSCGANVAWSGFPGVYGPNTTGPGIVKAASATGTVWFGGSTGEVGDSNATMSKRATAI